MSQCWAYEPSKRPSFKDIREVLKWVCLPRLSPSLPNWMMQDITSDGLKSRHLKIKSGPLKLMIGVICLLHVDFTKGSCLENCKCNLEWRYVD
jgi:hypothetical protein